MCGIAGFIDFGKRSDERMLKAMADSMVHRGPDASGAICFTDAAAMVGLGHRRLSIIDLTDTGSQPMNFGAATVTFNGEIYNFGEIRSELQALGHHFLGHSDTEVLLHAYSQWGIDCIQRFIGMFAFVLYDAAKAEVYCVRDRPGIKPFYYYHHDRLFLFASELKAFHQHPAFEKELDPDAVAAYMQFGNVPSPYCIFKHCYKLPPGHYLKYRIGAAADANSFTLHKYWDVYDAYNQPKLDIGFEEAKTETEKILKSAADYRMVADVPVGVFLSGGYDSACLTALLQKDRTEKLKTYTIAVPDIGLNEAPYAKHVAEYLGTDHHEYTCTPKEALELIDDLPFYYDEPFADSSAIPTSLVCKIARKEVTVALSADAGDEVFAGYNRYDYLMKYGRRIKNMPPLFRKAIAGSMHAVNADSIPYFRNRYNFHNRYEKMKSLLRDPSDRNLMLSLSRQFDEEALKELFAVNATVRETRYTSSDLKQEYYSPLSYMMAIDYQTYLPDDILQKVDRASMRASLEAREPYLDHRLIEWAARLPDEFKYKEGNKKYILKAITHTYIPQAMMERPKMGFAIPIENWMANELREKISHYLDYDRIKKQGLFNPEAVQELVAKFRNGKKEFGVKIWYLLMFQMWFDRWMK